LEIFLEILCNVLYQQLQQNAQLVYTLIYHNPNFEQFENDPKLNNLVTPLQKMITYFNNAIIEGKTQEKEFTINQVIEIIGNASLFWKNKDTIITHQYDYTENSSSKFFTICTWKIILNQIKHTPAPQ